MKRIFTLLFSVACVLAVFAKGPELTFADKIHEFGTIKEADGPVTHEFTFQNTGDEPLVIYTCIASCGCTTPEYPKEPIKPGEKSVIKVTYDPANRPGEFVKTVKVKNNGTTRTVPIKIAGTVVPKR